MLETKIIEFEKVYVLSNCAVAKNLFFKDRENHALFLEKANRYLSPICEILSYAIHNDQFVLVVRMHTKEEVDDFLLSIQSKSTLKGSELRYILSRQMQKLQISIVKTYNLRNERSGGMVKGRYKRFRFESQEEAKQWIEAIEKQRKLFEHKLKFKATSKKSKVFCARKWASWLCTSEVFYEYHHIKHRILQNFVRITNFKNLLI